MLWIWFERVLTNFRINLWMIWISLALAQPSIGLRIFIALHRRLSTWSYLESHTRSIERFYSLILVDSSCDVHFVWVLAAGAQTRWVFSTDARLSIGLSHVRPIILVKNYVLLGDKVMVAPLLGALWEAQLHTAVNLIIDLWLDKVVSRIWCLEVDTTRLTLIGHRVQLVWRKICSLGQHLIW